MVIKKSFYVGLGILLILDLFILPIFILLPDHIIKYGAEGIPILLSLISKNPLIGPINLIRAPLVRNVWLVLQLIIIAFLVAILWRPEKPKVSNRLSKDLGGPEAAGSGEFGTARWRTEKELEKTLYVVKSNEIKKGGIVVGAKKINNDTMKVYLESEDTHVLLLGATRSGKSRTVILPSIWAIGKTGDSMVLTDPKGELYERCKTYLEGKGYNVILLDFREPLRGNKWNVLQPVIDEVEAGRLDKANEAALDIAHAIVYQREHHGDPIWELGEKSVISGLIMAVVCEAEEIEKKHMNSVAMTLAKMAVYTEDGTCPLNEYITSLDMLHPARGNFATALMAPNKTRGSFFAGAMAKIQLFADPNIAQMTATQDHNLRDIGNRPTAVFLVIPDERSTRYVLASLYINQVYMALVEEAIKNGGRLKNRVHFLLDEFGNMPAIPDMDKKITVAGGRGMKFLLAIQDLAQLDELYGKRAKTITGNCHTWLYLSTSDPNTAKTISEKTGTYTIRTHSQNYSYNTNNSLGGSTGQNLTGRALLTPDEVMRWPRGYGLLLQARENPVRLPLPDLSQWPADRELIKLNPEELAKKEKAITVPYWIPIKKFSPNEFININKIIEEITIGQDSAASSQTENEDVLDII